MPNETHLRIGELSRRSGVSPELLRAWERRYDLLRPTRSPGGLRLYSPGDLERVRRMRHHMAQGLAAREAAALAAGPIEERPASAFDPQAARTELDRAMATFDEPRAQSVIDELLAIATIDAMLTQVVLPYLRDIGDGWQRGEVSVAHEHFASNVLRGRLLGLARGWGRGTGPRALLGCPPGERHDLGLIAFGLALRERGWRIDFLGSDTPAETFAEAARATGSTVIVLSAVTPEPLGSIARHLARQHRVAVGGAGSVGSSAEGVLVLADDPVAAAERVSRLER